jgi:hypothetical protein
MNSDSAFIIGDSHEICEDYTYSSEGSIYVADGCSSATNTDIGSRILVHSMLANDGQSTQGLAHAAVTAKLLGLKTDSLYATLLRVLIAGNTAIFEAWGDGVLAVKFSDGRIEYADLEFESGYPQYLSYDSEPNTKKGLISRFKGNPCLLTHCSLEDSSSNGLVKDMLTVKDREHVTEFPIKIDLDTQDVEVVAIFSDGIKTFVDSEGSAIPLFRMIQSLMKIPVRKGAFVKRQFNWLKRECAKQGWRHHDDVSMAAINFTKKESKDV